jgi:phosphopantetheinyl transferase
MPAADRILKEIHVWSARHSDMDGAGFCSSEDHLRAEALRDPIKRRNLQMRRQFIREFVAPVFGLDALKCSVRHLPNGQPMLIGDEGHGAIHLSISATDDFFVIAASSQLSIGIDVEAVMTPDRDLIARVLDPREIDDLDSIASTDKALAFTAFWTQKEAYLKLLGTGLRVEPRQAGAPLLTPERFKNWHALAVDSTYSAISWHCAPYVVSLCASNQKTPRVILHTGTDRAGGNS